jgi:hypothetical protein
VTEGLTGWALFRAKLREKLETMPEEEAAETIRLLRELGCPEFADLLQDRREAAKRA